MKSGNLIILLIIITLISCDESEVVPFEINQLKGDFNGDRYKDKIAVTAGNDVWSNVTVMLNDQSGSFNSYNWVVTNEWGNPGWVVAGDFDGDGDDDILSPNGMQLHLKASFRDGFSSHTFASPGSFSSNEGWTYAFDYNGDNVDELVSIENEYIYITESNINPNGEIDNFKSHNHLTPNNWSRNPADTWIEDINSDGKDEIVSKIKDQLYVREWDGSNFLMREL